MNMKKTSFTGFLFIACLILTTACSCLAAADGFKSTGPKVMASTGADAADNASTATDVARFASEVAGFATEVCKAVSGGPAKVLDIYNIRFMIRLTVTDEQLSAQGMTLDEAAAKYENEARSGIAQDEAAPDKCNVRTAEAYDCDAVYRLISLKPAVGGLSTPYETVRAAGDTMKFEACGLVGVGVVKDGEEFPGEFAVAKSDGSWKIINVFMTDESDTAGGK